MYFKNVVGLEVNTEKNKMMTRNPVAEFFLSVRDEPFQNASQSANFSAQNFTKQYENMKTNLRYHRKPTKPE